MTSRDGVMTSHGPIEEIVSKADTVSAYYSLNSLAMLTAMSLNAKELPENEDEFTSRDAKEV
jgi:hypothetical protein